jgi:zinc transport system permease protein
MTTLTTFLSYAFIQRSLAAGVILALVAALLGVFVVLRRMSFFSDAIAHASLAGVAVGLILSIHPTVGAVVVSVGIALLMGSIVQKRALSSDTAIGVLFSSSIAFAVFLISLMPNLRVDLSSLLFGDILAVSSADIWISVVLLVLTLIFFAFASKPLLTLVFNRDLVEVEQKNISRIDYAFLALLAMTIAVSLKIAGAILVSALIIVPAAAAQNLARNVRQMFFFSVAIAITSVISGMYLSFLFDSPSGSTIVLVASAMFLLSLTLKSRAR